MQLKSAVGSFFIEFAKFETLFVGIALRALSRDPVFVEHAEKLLDFEARLKLLERMAFARGVAPSLIADLEALLARARKLSDERAEVARNLVTVDLDSVNPYLGPVPAKFKPSKSRGGRHTRLAELEDLWIPTTVQVQAFTRETIEIQEGLRAIAEEFDRELLAVGSAPVNIEA